MTTIREFFTKIVQADKSAQEMLDKNLDRNKVYFKENEKGVMELTSKTEGAIKATSKVISDLAQEDVGQAVNLMSKMVKEGLIDSETLIKVFNGRYGLITQNMLREIDGDILKYAKRMEETVKLSDDYALQLKNLNNQWDIFKNNLISSTGGLMSGFKNVGDAILGTLNPALQNANNEHPILTRGIVNLGVSFASSAIGVGLFTKALALLKITSMTDLVGALKIGLTSLLNPWILLATAVGVFSTAIASNSLKIKESQLQLKINANNLKQTRMETEDLQKSYRNLNADLASIDYSSVIDTTDAVRMSIFNLSAETQNLITKITKLSNLKIKNPLESINTAQ